MLMRAKELLNAIDRGIDVAPATQWPVYGSPEPLDRTKYITASEIAKCARQIKLDKAAMLAGGYKPEAGTKSMAKDDWGFWERGHNIEAWAVKRITAGWSDDAPSLLYTGSNQLSFVDGNQSGTPDGVLLGAEEVGILELKSIDPRTNTGKLPKLEHVAQVMQNMDLVSHAFERTPGGGLLAYIDASNYKVRHVFEVMADVQHMDQLKDRADYITETAAEDLRPEGTYKRDGCKYCAHTRECSAMERAKNNGETYDAELKAASTGIFGQR